MVNRGMLTNNWKCYNIDAEAWLACICQRFWIGIVDTYKYDWFPLAVVEFTHCIERPIWWNLTNDCYLKVSFIYWHLTLWGQGWKNQNICNFIKVQNTLQINLSVWQKTFNIFQFTWQTYHICWQLSLIRFSILSWALTLAPIPLITSGLASVCNILDSEYNNVTISKLFPQKSSKR